MDFYEKMPVYKFPNQFMTNTLHFQKIFTSDIFIKQAS